MKPEMEPHPEPPRDLAGRSLPERTIDGPWYRFHPNGKDPLFYGRRKLYRFDAPDADFGVLYLGVTLDAAFLESFLQVGSRIITTPELRRKSLAVVRPAHPVKVVDLSVEGALARIGADARLFAGDRATAQRWSAALKAHPSRPAGILYPVRREPNHHGLALFEGAVDSLAVDLNGSLLDDPHKSALADLLNKYGLGLLEETE